MDFNHHPVLQNNPLDPLALNRLLQQLRRVQQATNEPPNNPRLPPIARNHHDGRNLARSQERRPIRKRRQENGNARKHERLAAPASANQPRLVYRLARRHRPTRVPLENSKLLSRHR
jgi:hypothetical protein